MFCVRSGAPLTADTRKRQKLFILWYNDITPTEHWSCWRRTLRMKRHYWRLLNMAGADRISILLIGHDYLLNVYYLDRFCHWYLHRSLWYWSPSCCQNDQKKGQLIDVGVLWLQGRTFCQDQLWNWSQSQVQAFTSLPKAWKTNNCHSGLYTSGKLELGSRKNSATHKIFDLKISSDWCARVSLTSKWFSAIISNNFTK